VFDLMYWPLLQMVIWGFITTFLLEHSEWMVRAGGLLIGAVLLWDVLVRGQFGMTLSLLEEMWSRNLANLFVSPLRPVEFAASLMGMSVIRSLIGVVPAALLAIPLFAYSIFEIGLPLIAFWAILVMFAWAVGLVISALLIRFGLAAESYAWASIFLLAPISGVYYPIETLPPWLQPMSWALPSTHVFEGMRALVIDHRLRPELLLSGFALNLVYIGAAMGIFLWAFERARERGQLLASGE
ncbi:MAG: ABC transporter permease, partial [Rhodospirillales bacterium]|nr:ABC transporter permease [Rhodospirillales bacterium]